MDKELYAKMLMERYQYMKSVNEEATKIYNKIDNKCNELSIKEADDYIESLPLKERNAWYKEGIIYKESSFKRLRIEITKILNEIEKGEDAIWISWR